MEIWTVFMHSIELMIGFLSAHFGLSEAMSIITFTMLVRMALMPISLSSAYKMQKNKEAINKIKPDIEELKTKFKDNPSELATRTMGLYKKHGITFIDRISLLNMGSQAVFGLGVFQTLKKMIFNSKFLWIANLAKPDLLLTAAVGVLMVIGMTMMPGTSFETSQMVILFIPVIISMIAVAALPSALGLYWATSNVFTIIQTLILRGLIARQRNTVLAG